jgi:hypothetical protein
MNDPDLFIAITSWNSALFLPHRLQSLRRTTGFRPCAHLRSG